MTAIRKIFIVLMILIFVATGMALILSSRGVGVIAPSALPPVSRFLHPDHSLIPGLVLLLLGLAPAVLKLAELRRSRFVAFDNPDGEVAIALHTIEDFIRRVAKGFPEVIQAKPLITPRPGQGVEIVLETVLEEGSNLPELTEALQQRIRTQLQELLGIENIAGIQITVVKIRSRPFSSVEKATE